MNSKFLKIIFFVLPVILFFSFFILIYLEYSSYKNINKDITFTTFIKSNVYKVLTFDINSKRIKKANINKKFYIEDDFTDNGFLLVSGYNIDHKTSIVTLFSLKDNKILHSWIPPIDEIHINSPNYTKEYNLKKIIECNILY